MSVQTQQGAPAVFLDRDGTIVEERHYLCKPEDVAIFPGVPAALDRLRKAGFRLFIITNQSGVGRGYFTMAEVEKVNQRMLDDLGLGDGLFDKIYIAPEAPSQPSRGRKPSPQFLLDAREEFNVDLSRSWVIGDKLIDLECGWNAGARGSILVRTGYGAETERTRPEGLGRALVVDSLVQAADKILQFQLAAGGPAA